MMRLLRPFLHCLSTPLIALHHQLEKEVAVCGAKFWSPSFWSRLNQYCLAKTHEISIWLMVSSD
uniref:Uncharacterized protein n=1 Tax=Arundo donax TaxID=35708 RepID=A0A0A8YIG2_ARUDO